MLAALLMSVSVLSGCRSKKEQLQADGYISSLEISSTIDYVNTAYIKSPQHANPISSEMFCADPTAIEYNGRLYVFGTNSCFREAASDSTTGSSFNKSTQPSKSLILKTVCGYYNIFIGRNNEKNNCCNIFVSTVCSYFGYTAFTAFS